MDPGRGRLRRRSRRGLAALRRALREPRRRPRHARARQRAPPPLPDADAHPCAGCRPLHLAEELYPLWARIDAEAEYAAARTGLAELALAGCTTVFDHHYVFPAGRSGIVEAEIEAARELGVRIVASRGSMDVGESEGGLPPDDLVEEIDAVLEDTEGLVRPPRGGARCLDADRRRALLALLRLETADDGVGGARAATRPAAAHSPGRDRRGGGVLPGPLRLSPDRVPGASGLASRRRLVRALRPPVGRGRARVRRGRDRGRALPDLQPSPRRRRGAGAGDARRRRPGRARGRRLRLERAQRSRCRREAGAAGRPRAGRARRVDRT